MGNRCPSTDSTRGQDKLLRYLHSSDWLMCVKLRRRKHRFQLRQLLLNFFQWNSTWHIFYQDRQSKQLCRYPLRNYARRFLLRRQLRRKRECHSLVALPRWQNQRRHEELRGWWLPWCMVRHISTRKRADSRSQTGGRNSDSHIIDWIGNRSDLCFNLTFGSTI
jgi:hypothetical protein